MPLRLLVVEDDPALLFAVRDGLQAKFPDAALAVADSGDRAVAVLNASAPFDAVLADIRMEGLNGVDLLRVVKGRFPDCVVLLMTGCEPDRRVEALRLGAASFLEKPIEIDRLAHTLSRAVNEAHLLNALHERNRRSHMGPDQF